MPELRKDPVSGGWVIIAVERGKRPTDFASPPVQRRKGGFCPFCPGNEYTTPPEIMAILRDAFSKVLKDKELLADAEKQQLDLKFVPYEECLKVLDIIFNQPDDVVKEFAKYIKF